MKDRREELRAALTEAVLARIDGSKELSDEELRELIEQRIREAAGQRVITAAERVVAKRDVFNALRGLDVLQDLMDDPDITEIMVNGADDIFYEKDGELYRSSVRFSSEKKLNDVIQKIAADVNRVVNEANPIVDARLRDGSRVNVVLPPVSLNGPTVTIRKFPKDRITMEHLIRLGSISAEAAEYMRTLVLAGYNIVVSGGTGSGKTTMLNALSDYIPADERVVTIEDSAELQISNIPNLVRLEMRNANMEGNHAVTIRDLIKTSLRMRPSRIIVGEVRDAASIDMLQSLNTGHNGMSTGHANSPADMLSRIETMTLLGEEIPLLAVRKQIASAIEIIIQLGRMRDRTRKVTEITEILACVDGEIILNPLFRFREKGEAADGMIIGELEPTGNRLQRRNKLLAAGLSLADPVGNRVPQERTGTG
ncbi:MAG: CpaF family protein [Lachnospiraceae bacterium]|nr:CpaF family protein [Lachnospiraceae bacterium]